MMSRIAEVLSFERVSRNGVTESVVKVDGDADPSTVQHFAPPGDDSPPLPGDYAQLVETSDGQGGEAAVGYSDPRNDELAAPGEKRLVGRASSGAIRVTLWLKGDGSMTIDNGSGTFEMAANGEVTINGVVIGTDGSVTAPGEVTAKSLVPGGLVNLSTHTHPAPGGTTSPPTPGT
jgi:hypothetical protein